MIQITHHACSGPDMKGQIDCEEKRDPDQDASRQKNENKKLDPNAQLEKKTLACGRKRLKKVAGHVHF